MPSGHIKQRVRQLKMVIEVRVPTRLPSPNAPESCSANTATARRGAGRSSTASTVYSLPRRPRVLATLRAEVTRGVARPTADRAPNVTSRPNGAICQVPASGRRAGT